MLITNSENKHSAGVSYAIASYPYDKEKLLFHTIAGGDMERSRAYMNEILGHIFFSSADSLEIIKVRAMELAFIISRAAIEAGADGERVLRVNMEFAGNFVNLTTLEDICRALTDILYSYTEEATRVPRVGRAGIVGKAVAYINSNYMHKVTLEETASCVFLSPSHFSKLFRAETGFGFSHYVNRVRVDKSRVLLLDTSIRMVDIVEMVGFYDQSYFSKVFKKNVGMTPKQYRDSNGLVISIISK